MRLLHLAVFGLALATAACGADMEEKPATGGLAGAGAGVGGGAGAATQKIEDRSATQSGSGATYSAPASRSTVTR